MFHGSPPLRAPKLADGGVRTNTHERAGPKAICPGRRSPYPSLAYEDGRPEENMSIQEIPGSTGLSVRLEKGEAIRLVNTFGSQVVDTWALAAADTSEYLSV